MGITTRKKLVLLLISSTIIIFLAKLFLYIDIPYGCMIVKVPSLLPSNSSVNESLKIIKHTSPKEYSLICEDVKFINKNPACGGLDGGCYYENKEHTLFVGNDQRNESFAAVIVIHELCHRQQAKENRPFSEPECYKAGSDFLDMILVY